jgi:hypothetical protein
MLAKAIPCPPEWQLSKPWIGVSRSDARELAGQIAKDWLSIERVLFGANVAAPETYNTALEQHLRQTCGSPNGPAPTRPSGRSGRSSVSTLG